MKIGGGFAIRLGVAATKQHERLHAGHDRADRGLGASSSSGQLLRCRRLRNDIAEAGTVLTPNRGSRGNGHGCVLQDRAKRGRFVLLRGGCVELQGGTLVLLLRAGGRRRPFATTLLALVRFTLAARCFAELFGGGRRRR